MSGSNNTRKKPHGKTKLVAAAHKPTVVKQSSKKQSAQSKLTATQLRNARKRKAKKKQQQTRATKGENGKPSCAESNSNNLAGSNSDPSAQYLKNPKAAPVVRAAKEFFSDRLASFPIYQNCPKMGWRTVSKLPVRRQQQQDSPKSKSRVVIGMFQPNSHQVASQNNNKKSASYNYPAHHPSINHTIASLTLLVQEMGVDVYNELDGSGYLRYVAMNVERSTGKVQLTLIWNHRPYESSLTLHNATNGSKKKRKRSQEKQKLSDDVQDDNAGHAQLERLLTSLLKQANERNSNLDSQNTQKGNDERMQLHSIWVHYNSAWKHSNAIFDIQSSSKNVWYHVYGPKTVPEQLRSLTNTKSSKPTLHFAPNVFRQANLDAFAHIINAIRKRIQLLSKGQQFPLKCLELYGGVGTIGLHLLDLSMISTLICSDENPYNKDCFARGLASLSKANAKKATYVPQNASTMVTDSRKFLQDCHVLIVDPPRKGLDEAVLDALVKANHGIKNNIHLVVYVSCGFDAFQRDCIRLTESTSPQHQQWNLEHAEGHILFPGSNAIETLAFFTPCS